MTQNEPHVVVGINDSHDASACVLVEGRIMCALAEERIQRIKSMSGFPKNAVEKCLEIVGLDKRDVDYVAVASHNVSCMNLHNWLPTLSIADLYRIQEEYWHPILNDGLGIKMEELLPEYRARGEMYYPMREIPFAPPRELDEFSLAQVRKTRRQFIENYFGLPSDRVVFFDHHHCHRYYGFFADSNSRNGQDFLVISADAGGDHKYESLSIFNANQGEVRSVHEGNTCFLAVIYSYITLLLGMKPHEHEYKLMGMAPYVREHIKSTVVDVFRKCLKIESLSFIRNPDIKDLFSYFQKELKTFRFDAIMAAVQDFTEELVAEWVTNAIQETGVAKVIFTGGLAHNVKVNKRLCELQELESLYVPPGPGDESLSIGATFALFDSIGERKDKDIQPINNAFLGSSASTNEIDALLKHPIVTTNYAIKEGVTPDDVACKLANGELCAVFVKEMEFGPRALGHRSILADPRRPDMVNKINNSIKLRDFWMPFTCSILDTHMDKYVVNPKGVDCSFMTQSLATTDLGKEHLRAAIHPYDQSARPQRVSQKDCPQYYQLIRAFEGLTGVGAVLNTSLNIHGKPIVMKPIQIAEELLSKDQVELDNIYVDGYLLTKILKE